MELLAAASAAARSHASAFFAEAMRATAWCVTAMAFALAAVALLAAGAIVALAERIGTAEALGVGGASLAIAAAVIFALMRRRRPPPPRIQGNVFAPTMVRQDIEIDPRFPGGVIALVLLAGAGYLLGKRRL